MIEVTIWSGTKFEESVSVEVERKQTYWIAHCAKYKTFGYSHESAIEAINDFRRAINTFKDVHIERGTFEKSLKYFGQ